MILKKNINLLLLLISTGWVTSSKDWESIIVFIGFLSGYIFYEIQVIKEVKKLKLNKKKKNNIVCYEHIFTKKEDIIELDGTQTSMEERKMLANADMPGYKSMFSSISGKLFPFRDFSIEILSYNATKDNNLKIEIFEKSDRKQRYQLSIEPPLKQNEELIYVTKAISKGTRIMCYEDLIEVAKINKDVKSLIVTAWRTISVPCEKFIWEISFPENYKIKNLQPYVMRQRNEIKNMEVELEVNESFKCYIDSNGQTKAKLSLDRPLLYYNYGFAWIPPDAKEYEELCEIKNISPQRCQSQTT